MEEEKKMNTFSANNIRSIVEFVNNNQIKKEDCFTIVKDAIGQLVLIYFN